MTKKELKILHNLLMKLQKEEAKRNNVRYWKILICAFINVDGKPTIQTQVDNDDDTINYIYIDEL